MDAGHHGPPVYRVPVQPCSQPGVSVYTCTGQLGYLTGVVGLHAAVTASHYHDECSQSSLICSSELISTELGQFISDEVG